MRFRDDINGLRALAVALVVLYHFRIGLAPGGFAGVDVFFAISGFLMTQIIIGKLDHGCFSLVAFYGARVRRIVPAMTVLVTTAFVVGASVLNPLQLEGLAHSALASLLFFSNISYSREVGYFAAPAEDNWLIHTWSLSVEWQFYVLYPLALMVLAWLGVRVRATPRRAIALFMLAAAAASLAIMVRNWISGGGLLQTGFFLLPGRAWEFLAGGMAVVAGPRLALPERGRRALHVMGLGLIALGVALVDRTSAWPSPLTALSVLGTALVLLAGCERAWWARLAPVRALGKWSYSIYLWHWPIVAVLAFCGLDGRAPAIAGIAASVLCGWASYALVETRLTETFWQSAQLGRPLAGSAFAAVAGLALFTVQTNGLEKLRFGSRPDILAAAADARAARNDWTYPKSCDRFRWDAATNDQRCDFGDPTRHDTLVIGDSFAQQLTPRFSHALTRAGVAFYTQGGCPPIPGVERPMPGTNCGGFVERAYAYAQASPFRRIVVAAFWPGYGRDNLCVGDGGACTMLDKAAFDVRLREAFARMAARWRALREAGKTVVVLDIPPFGSGDPVELYAKAVAGAPVTALERPLVDLRAETHDASAMLAAAAQVAGVAMVDPSPALCPGGRCPMVVAGHTQYKDAAHLRASVLTQPRFAIYDALIAPDEAAAAPPTLRASAGRP